MKKEGLQNNLVLKQNNVQLSSVFGDMHVCLRGNGINDLLHQKGLVDTQSHQDSNRQPEALWKIIACKHPHCSCHGNVMGLCTHKHTHTHRQK